MDIKNEIMENLVNAEYKDGVVYYNGYRIFLNTKGRIVVANSYECLNNHRDFRKENLKDVIDCIKTNNEYKLLYECKELNVESIDKCCEILNKFTFITSRIAVTVFCNGERTKRFSRFIDAHVWDDILTLYNCVEFSRDYNIKEITSVEVEYHKFGEINKLTINLV